MPFNYEALNRENAYVPRIIHRSNILWTLENGLSSCNSEKLSDRWVDIGNLEIIDRRKHKNVPIEPMGTLADYVPFYFTPFSPMMYNIHTGRGIQKQKNEDILILVSSLHQIQEKGIPFVFTDRHALLEEALFYNDIENLDMIDWDLLQARNFKRNPDDPEQIERYMAEALIRDNLPVTALSAIICYTKDMKLQLKAQIEELNLEIDVLKIPSWYF